MLREICRRKNFLSKALIPVLVLFALAPVAARASGTQFGVCINARNDDQAPQRAQVVDLGARWVRTAVYKGLESRLSTVAPRYSGQAKILVVLNHETINVIPPASTASDSAWSSYINTFASAIRSLAVTYDSVIGAYEIWNEANINFNMPATRFAQLVQATSTQLRQVTTKPIIIGGLAGNNANWQTYLQTTIANLPAQFYDGVGFHPYEWRADGFPTRFTRGEIEAVINTVFSIGRSKPVWVTEFGVSQVDMQSFGGEAGKAEYLRRAYALLDGMGPTKVAAAFWFAWDDRIFGPLGPTNPAYGLVDSNHLPRDSWNRFRRVLCGTYTTATECSASYANNACDAFVCNGGAFTGCFPVGTNIRDACSGNCGAYETIGHCNLNSSACAWYACANLCLQRGTPVATTCSCVNFDGATACDQNSSTCAYYLCKEKCLARGTPVANTCNFF